MSEIKKQTKMLGMRLIEADDQMLKLKYKTPFAFIFSRCPIVYGFSSDMSL